MFVEREDTSLQFTTEQDYYLQHPEKFGTKDGFKLAFGIREGFNNLAQLDESIGRLRLIKTSGSGQGRSTSESTISFRPCEKDEFYFGEDQSS